ncbi:MAG: MarR family transcriptional regulator [Methanoregulaceae archaeon]|nr:MarR family transcriptional regulator [Methanoregulaceae archaeon]
MKEEDLDWWIYHILADEPCQDIAALSGKTGHSRDEVADSLDRLEKALLIERYEGRCRIRSVQEVLLSCRSKYDDTSPFIIENGIIKERKKPE